MPVFTAVRSKQRQVGKPACREPWEPAAVIHPPECRAPVTLSRASQIGGLESFTAHGLHGMRKIASMSFYEHAQSGQ